jgi:predicted DNA-binding protein with PD1-like motif
MGDLRKVYVPAGNWLVATLSAWCAETGIANAMISGIGSITDVWAEVNSEGHPVPQNWPAGTSYEMTSLSGNVALRQGRPVYDPSRLASGAYPQWDATDPELNPFLHLHVTFADAKLAVTGGHLLDAQVSVGAEVFALVSADPDCTPPLTPPPPDGCVTSVPVTVDPYGTFSNWDKRFWFPAPTDAP